MASFVNKYSKNAQINDPNAVASPTVFDPKPTMQDMEIAPVKPEESRSTTERVFKGIGAGAVAAFDETINTAVEVTEWIGHHTKMLDESEDWNWKEFRRENYSGFDYLDEDFGVAGNLARSITKFGVGMVAFGILGKVAKAGQLGKAIATGVKGLGSVGGSMVAGAAVDFTMSTEDEGLLGDFLKETALAGHSDTVDAVFEFLSTDEDTSTLELKLKATLEGGALGLGVEAAVSSFKGIAMLLKGGVRGADTPAMRSALARIGADDKQLIESWEEGMLTKKGYGTRVASGEEMPNLKRGDEAMQQEIRGRLAEMDGDALEVTIKTHPEVVADVLLTKSDFKADDVVNLMNKAGMWEQGTELQRFTEHFTDTLVTRALHGDEKTWKIMGDMGIDLTDITADNIARETGAIMGAVYKRFYLTKVDSISAILNVPKGKRTAVQHTILRNDLLIFADIGPQLRDNFSGAGRALRNLRQDVALGYKPDGSAVKLTKEMDDKTARYLQGRLKDDASFDAMEREIRAAGGIDAYFSQSAKSGVLATELTAFQKWSRGYEAYRRDNLLSALSTGVVNTVSTAMKIALDQQLSKMVAGLRTGDASLIKEGFHSFHGFWNGARETAEALASDFNLSVLSDIHARKAHFDGIRAIPRASREGAETMSWNSAKALGMDDTTAGAKLYDAFVNINNIGASFNMNIPDTIQSGGALSGFVEGRVARDLVTEKMSVEQIRNLKDNVKELIQVAVKNNGRLPAGIPLEHAKWFKELADESMEIVPEALFQQQAGWMGRIASAANRVDNPVGRIVISTIAPFMTTPINLANTLVEMTPAFGSLSSRVRKELLSDDITVRSVREAKQMVGAMLYSTGAMLYLGGNLTGSHTKNDREALEAAGIPEHGLKIGDTWYNYTRLDPFGSFLGIMADVMQSVEVASTTNEVMEGANMLKMGLGELTANKTYLKGIGDLYKAINDPERDKDGFLKNWASSMVPMSSGQRWINNISDPVMRDNYEMVDRLKGVIAGAGKTREAKLDAMGGEIPRPSAISAIFGIRTTSDEHAHVDKDVMREIVAVRAWPSDRDGQYQGVKLTREEAKEAKAYAFGNDSFGKLERLVQSGVYRRADLKTRQKKLKALIMDIRESSRKDMLRSNVEAKARHREVRRKIASVGARRVSSGGGDMRQILEQRLELGFR